jgi:hypothetical protein
MPDTCDTSEGCSAISAELLRICEETEQAIEDSWNNVQPMRDIVNGHQGAFVETPPSRYLPTLAELVGRINTFGTGFSEWSFFEFRTHGTRVAINMPSSISDTDKVAVALNAARLTSPRDYTISGSVLTLTYPLDHRDWLVLKSYGGA